MRMLYPPRGIVKYESAPPFTLESPHQNRKKSALLREESGFYSAPAVGILTARLRLRSENPRFSASVIRQLAEADCSPPTENSRFPTHSRSNPPAIRTKEKPLPERRERLFSWLRGLDAIRTCLGEVE